jgi:hypothetical protein
MRSDLLYDKQDIRKVDTRRGLYLVMAIMAFLITEFGRFVYRPYIYENDIYDYGLADGIGNLGGIVVQVFAMLTVFNSYGVKAFRLIVFLVMGYILYEFLQPVMPKGVFDPIDVYATFMGGFVAFLLVLIIQYGLKENKVYFNF